MPHTPGTCPSAGQCRLVQAARPCLSGQQHLPAGDRASHTVPVGPRCAREHGGGTGIPRNKCPSAKNGTCGWGGGFRVNPHYGQDATHTVRKIPVPLWHSPNEHVWSKKDSCWGYNHKNSTTICLLRVLNLPPPPGSPRVLKKKAGCFLEWGLVRPWPPASSLGPWRHRFGVMSNACRY